MKLLSRLFRCKPATVPTPAVILKIIEPGYNTNTSIEEMQADYETCCASRSFVRQNWGEDTYSSFLRLLDSFSTLIEANRKLAQCRANEQSALAALEAKQPPSFVN